MRVEWWDLFPDEREAIKAWCRQHNIDVMRTPVDALVELDETTNEWRVEQWHRPVRLGSDGEPIRYVIRRRAVAPFPWRTES